MREDVHAGRVDPDEEGLAGGVGVADEGDRLLKHLVVDGLHALAGQRAGVRDALRTVGIREGVDDPRGPKDFLNSGSSG